MSTKFTQGLSPAQIAFARKVQDSGVASFSKAVKALKSRDAAQIAAWKLALSQPKPAPTAVPTADKPAVPTADKPAVPTADKPAVPAADKPAVPTADKPAVPAAVVWVNLTPHTVNVRLVNGATLDIAPSGQLARCAETRRSVGGVGGIAVAVAEYGDVEGLPEPKKNTYFIVSSLVLARVPGRADVFCPGPAIRDNDGKIVGCDGLSGTPAFAAVAAAK